MDWEDNVAVGETSPLPFETQSPNASLLRFTPYTQPDEEEAEGTDEDAFSFINQETLSGSQRSGRKLKGTYGRANQSQPTDDLDGSPTLADDTPPSSQRQQDNASSANSFGTAARGLF